MWSVGGTFSYTKITIRCLSLKYKVYGVQLLVHGLYERGLYFLRVVSLFIKKIKGILFDVV